MAETVKSTCLPQPGNLLENPTLSIIMIVRDEEKNLPRCLKSVVSIADELIIVDTGSKDNTIDIAKEFGAKVFHFKWCDDFSAPRNESLKHATGDWIFQLDADDELLPTSVPPLQSKLNRSDLLFCGTRYDNGPASYGLRFNRIGRLFRNHPKVQYSGRYHERVDSSVQAIVEREPQWKVEYDKRIIIRHYGYEQSSIRAKCERGLRIMELHLRDNPDDAYVIERLGTVYGILGQHEKAEHYFRKALHMNSVLPEINYSLGVTLYNQNKLDSAVMYLKKACAVDSELAEAFSNLGAIYLRKEMLEEAISELKRALQINPELPQAHNHMGIALSYKGQLKMAISHFSKAIMWGSDYAEAHSNMGSALARQGKLDEAVRHYEEAIRIKPDFSEAKHYLKLALRALEKDKNGT